MRSKKSNSEDHENTERWLVSYADFITLLFAFFVVMYSISSVSESKYRVLSDTMTEAFKTPPKSSKPIQIGEPAHERHTAGQQPISPVIHQEVTPEQRFEDQMKTISEKVQQVMSPLLDDGMIKVKQDRLWVEVEINTRMLFPSGSAELEPGAIPALSKLAATLKDLPNHIDVEGHTDNVPISNLVFPSNWELSAARSASVVHLFTSAGLDPGRLSAIGYGEFRPLASNDELEGRLRNRRVSVIILAHKDARRMTAVSGEPLSRYQAPNLQ